MRSILEYLLGGKELRIPFVTESMMQDHCPCGKFSKAWFLRQGDVEIFYFSNLEDWKKTHIVDVRRWRLDV